MKKAFTFTLLLLLVSTTGQLTAQKVGIKTNLAYWVTTTPNIGLEFALGKKLTLDLSGGYNFWVLDKETQVVDGQEKVWQRRRCRTSWFNPSCASGHARRSTASTWVHTGTSPSLTWPIWISR